MKCQKGIWVGRSNCILLYVLYEYIYNLQIYIYILIQIVDFNPIPSIHGNLFFIEFN